MIKRRILIIAVVYLMAVPAVPADRSIYLDTAYANQNFYLTDEQKAERCPAAKQFFDRAYALYKQKQDFEAVAWYEKSLEKYSSPETYYHYANSLSNIGEFENAVKAYSVSVSINFDRSELAYYNMACSYSKLKDTASAFRHLKLAVMNGYPQLSYISKDPDLAYVRKSEDYKRKYAELEGLYHKGNIDFVKGKKLVHEVASSEDVYSFKTDGTVEVRFMVSEDINHRRTGTYSVKNYIVHIQWEYESGEKGVGKPKNCASACSYSGYEPYRKKINQQEKLRWTVINSDEDGLWSFR